MLSDSFGRTIDYLRVSVTDRCNLHCLYCLPSKKAREGSEDFVPASTGFSVKKEILAYEEILRIVSIAAQLGIAKIRLTGGEPLVRPQIAQLIQKINQIPEIKDLSLSTNGILLSKFAHDLYKAGLKRINISLDSFDPQRFRSITRFGHPENILQGISKALKIGFSPVKINVVVMRGINSDEIPHFVSLAKKYPLHVRFIELMPIGETGFFSQERWMPIPEIKTLCGPLEPVTGEEAPLGSGPARYFKAPQALGTVGFISALSCNFCQRCNRLRLTSKGRLVACLASNLGLNLREPLRDGASDEEIANIFREVVAKKPERHQMRPEESSVRESFMCALGG